MAALMFPAEMKTVIMGTDREVFPFGEGLFTFVFLPCERCSGLQRNRAKKRPCSQER